MSPKLTCKNCGEPIKRSQWKYIEWTHAGLKSDNDIQCQSTTHAEPKEY